MGVSCGSYCMHWQWQPALCVEALDVRVPRWKALWSCVTGSCTLVAPGCWVLGRSSMRHALVSCLRPKSTPKSLPWQSP